MHRLLVLAACVVASVGQKDQRIVGGELTSVSVYPFSTSLLNTWDGGSTYTQSCGGAILTSDAILSAAHCFDGQDTWTWRARVGSDFANSGGTVHLLRTITNHPDYDPFSFDNDISILRTETLITFITNAVQPASIAGYDVANNQPLWAIGWGSTDGGDTSSEQLRHVNIWHLSLEECRDRYAVIWLELSDNMLCSGWWDIGGRGQCSGDSGSPLVDANQVIVGVTSWGIPCATGQFGTVNTRVANYVSWIQSAAS